MKTELRKSAIKDLKKIQNPYKDTIHKKILELQNFPSNFEPAFRLRVGDYRILFDCIEDTFL